MINGAMPALVTPQDIDGGIRTELAESLIDLYTKQGAEAVYMLGWTGEGWALDVEKRKTWAEAVLKAAENKIKVIVHVGYNKNLDDSVELARHAAELGAYAVSSVGISREASLQENIDYFKKISEAAPNIPFYIYWVDHGRTLTNGREMSPSELLSDMKEVPTFSGIKFTDTDFFTLERMKKHAPQINIVTGADEMAFQSQLSGADGNIGALQAITCYHHRQIFELVKEGKVTEAHELQVRANDLSEVLGESKYGKLPCIKGLMKRIYGIDVGYCSPTGPYANIIVPDDELDNLEKVFRDNILIQK